MYLLRHTPSSLPPPLPLPSPLPYRSSFSSKVLVKLYKGAAFGELALVNDAPRAASVVAQDTVQMLVLNKHDYITVLQKEQTDKMNRRVVFLQQLTCFSGWEKSTLNAVAGILQQITHHHNSVIIKEGDVSNSLFFIESGSCRVLKKFRVKEAGRNVLRLVEISHLGAGDMFGEVSVANANKRRMASVLSKGTTSVFELNPYDATRIFGKGMGTALSSMGDDEPHTGYYSDAELQQAYTETATWESYKGYLMKDILRQRHAHKLAGTGTHRSHAQSLRSGDSDSGTAAGSGVTGGSGGGGGGVSGAGQFHDSFDSVELRCPEPLKYQRLRMEHKQMYSSNGGVGEAGEGGATREAVVDQIINGTIRSTASGTVSVALREAGRTTHHTNGGGSGVGSIGIGGIDCGAGGGNRGSGVGEGPVLAPSRKDRFSSHHRSMAAASGGRGLDEQPAMPTDSRVPQRPAPESNASRSTAISQNHPP